MTGWRLKFEPDDNGAVLVTSPDIPELTTFGSDRADAERQARFALEEAIAARIAAGQDIPPGGLPDAGEMSMTPPLQAHLKTLLYMKLRELDLSRADLQRLLGWGREQVDRLFRLDHASRIDQLEQAFHALGQQVEIELTAA